MAVTLEVLEQVRAALASSGEVEHTGIDVEGDGETVVLRGAVPAAGQAETAALVASWYATEIDNRLRVDPHLREDPTDPAAGGDAPARDRPPRSEELSVQTSGVKPEPVAHDLQGDAHTALAENTPLDPPDAPHGAPSEAEQRGVTDRDTRTERTAEPGDQPTSGAASLPDLSREELERSARPQRRDDPARRGREPGDPGDGES